MGDGRRLLFTTTPCLKGPNKIYTIFISIFLLHLIHDKHITLLTLSCIDEPIVNFLRNFFCPSWQPKELGGEPSPIFACF